MLGVGTQINPMGVLMSGVHGEFGAKQGLSPDPGTESHGNKASHSNSDGGVIGTTFGQMFVNQLHGKQGTSGAFGNSAPQYSGGAAMMNTNTWKGEWPGRK